MSLSECPCIIMKFTFTSRDNRFSCNMQCTRCTCKTKTGATCRRRSCIGTGYCWAHLLEVRHLRIKRSDQGPGAGRGLFAVDLSIKPGSRASVFRKGDFIVDYDGQRVTAATVERRYGEWTAPYTVQNANLEDGYEDAACRRGVGSIANQSKTRPNAEFVSFGSRVALFALKAIRNHTEVLVDYNGEYQLDEPTRHVTR